MDEHETANKSWTNIPLWPFVVVGFIVVYILSVHWAHEIDAKRNECILRGNSLNDTVTCAQAYPYHDWAHWFDFLNG